MIRGAILVFVGLIASSGASGWVTNRRTDLDYAAQLKLDTAVTVKSQLGLMAGCTATLLNPTTVILAGHCINEKNKTGGVSIEGVESIAVYTQYAGIAEADKINKETDRAKARLLAIPIVKKDLAVLVFPEGFGEFLGVKQYPRIVERQGVERTAYLLGYGMSSLGEGAGVLGWGTTDIIPATNGIIEVQRGVPSAAERGEGVAVGERVSALNGDSGSAAYNAEGQIIGIVSSVMPETEMVETTRSYGPITVRTVERRVKWFDGLIVDVTSEESKELFKEAIECKQGACAGNFAGSGVPEDRKPILTRSPDNNNAALFSHRTLRTGRYRCVDEGCDRPDLAISSDYQERVLKRVEVHNLLQNHRHTRHPAPFHCEEAVCTSGYDRTVTIEVGAGDAFIFKSVRLNKSFNFARVK